MNSTRDPITLVAIKFILGVILGFAFILMGIVFFMIGVLASATPDYERPASFWFVGMVIFEIVGISMMYYSLSGSPKPGDLPTY